jgi:hypothetical protein
MPEKLPFGNATHPDRARDLLRSRAADHPQGQCRARFTREKSDQARVFDAPDGRDGAMRVGGGRRPSDRGRNRAPRKSPPWILLAAEPRAPMPLHLATCIDDADEGGSTRDG